MQTLRPKRGKMSFKMGTTPSPNQSGNQKLARSQIHVRKISIATVICKLQRFARVKRLKLTFPSTYFPPECYFRNRKVPENSGNDSRYNRCNVYHNTMLTNAFPTGWWDNWSDSKPFQMTASTSAFHVLSAERSAQKNFHVAIISRLATDVKHGRIWQSPTTDRQRSLLMHESSNATLTKHFARW